MVLGEFHMAEKRKIAVMAREACQRFDYDPLQALVLYAQDNAVSADVKVDIAKTLLPYMYPKLSNVTVEGEVRDSSQSNQVMLMQRILANPQLADAAQRLSLAAAEVALEGDDIVISGGMVQ